MIRYFYTLLLLLIQPFLLLLMVKRGRRQPEYRKRLLERYAIYRNLPEPNKQGLLVHAASVGEVIAATPLIKYIQKQYPQLAITVTTVTPTGSARVTAAFGESVQHFYLPYDLPFAMQRFLRFIQPKLVVVIETELWPNFIVQAKRQQMPFIIANARLSPRSAKRYGWIKKTMQGILANIELIMAQDQISLDRYLALGVSTEHLINTGNLKFDLEISEQLRQKVAKTAEQLAINQRPVWIAGSTHDGEEQLILTAHKNLLATYPDLVLILVPRHPERFTDVENLIKKSQLNYQKRSDKISLQASDSVLLGDTMGEMMVLYGLAKIAFVGGSLVHHGGHNPLEPIAYQLPVISGKHTFNFPEIFSKLRDVHGVVEIEDSSEALQHNLAKLLHNTTACRKIGSAGFSVLRENQGALKRQFELLRPYLERK